MITQLVVWSLMTGALILIFVMETRAIWRFATNRPVSDKFKKILPWIAFGLGVVINMFANFDGAGRLCTALAGLLSGAVAIALWEAIVKHLVAKDYH